MDYNLFVTKYYELTCLVAKVKQDDVNLRNYALVFSFHMTWKTWGHLRQTVQPFLINQSLQAVLTILKSLLTVCWFEF